jgi:glutathione transport system substrate-binding protein
MKTNVVRSMEKYRISYGRDLPLLCIASDKNIWATSNNITGVYLLGDGSIGMRNARMAAE